MVAVLVLGWRPTSSIGRNRRTRRLRLAMVVVIVVLVTASTNFFVGAGFFIAQEGRHCAIIACPATRWAIVVVPATTAATERIATRWVMPASVARLSAVLHLRVVRRSTIHVMIRLVTRIERGVVERLARPPACTVGSQKMIRLVVASRVVHLLRIVDSQRFLGSVNLLFLPVVVMIGNHNVLWIGRWGVRVDLPKVAPLLLDVRSRSLIDSQIDVPRGLWISVSVLPFPARRIPGTFVPIFGSSTLGIRL
jgi:hypothetical protein